VEHKLAAIEAALATVQRTLDQLQEKGHHEAAFKLARLQYAASIRASWPGNLLPLAGALESVAGDSALSFSEADRAKIREASATLRDLIA
jgi:hypothetical protein